MINFPIKKYHTKEVIEKELKRKKINNTFNRGMYLEDLINETITYYNAMNITNIHKKPTPIKVVKVEYPSRSKAKIIEGYYTTPSTTDYNGIYKSKYIDFEAKETNNTAFSFQLIHSHQIKHLISCNNLGGISFLLVYFKKYNEVYLLDIKDFLIYYNKINDSDGRKSIAYESFKKNGVLIKQNYLPKLNLIDAIDLKYFNLN